MTHRFFVAADQVRGEMVSFSKQQSHQLRSVLRLRPGETVRVFDGAAPVDRVAVLVDHATARIDGTCAHAAEPRTKLIVYPALVQREKLESVLQKLTEIGAAAIVPVLTLRSVVREPPDARRVARWRSIVREAAEQCGRGVVPDVEPPRPLLGALDRAAGTLVMAYEGEQQRDLKQALAGAGRIVSLFVGPEGGYDPTEVAAAEAAGARLTTLGPRVLRTETASPVLAALVLYELGDLSSARDDNARS